MLRAHSLQGGLLNSPNLTGQDALRVLAYWWRTRGRFWSGWHQALAQLQATGLKPTADALNKVFTPEQSAIVWDAALDAAKDMTVIKSARGLTPRAFEQLQTEADAKTMLRRFFVKDLDSKIPPLQKTAKAAADIVDKLKPRSKRRFPPELPDLPDPDKIPRPRIPKRPGLGGLGWLLLAIVVLSGRD